MRRNPGFFFVAVSSLALALGLSSTVFAHIDSLTHPSVPVRDIDRLYKFFVMGDGNVTQPSGDEIAQMVSAVPAFEGVAYGNETNGTASAGDRGGDVTASAVAPEYFDILGLKPRLGRLFSKDETEENGVAIVGDLTWKLLFNDKTEIGNSSITYRGRTYAVVGVLPQGVERVQGAAIWFARPAHYSRYTYFIGRLKHSVTAETAQADLRVMTSRLISTYAIGHRPFSANFHPAKPDPMQLQTYHSAMIGAALCILIIACANVAALMLARGVVKRRDQAVRLSLGASGSDLLTSVAAEVFLLAVMGGAAGLLLAMWSAQLVHGLLPDDMAAIGIRFEANWSWRVLAESFAAMVTAVALAASLPAWYATRISPSEPLKQSSGTTTGRSGSRFRLLVIGELAISMVLLMGSTLIAKATRNVAHFDFGYDARPLFVTSANVMVRPDSAKHSVDSLNAAGKRRQITETQLNAAVERLRSIRGVASAAVLSGGMPDKRLVSSDQSRGGANTLEINFYLNVGPEFMKTLGVPIIEGRDFVAGDRAGRGAVILDEVSAKQLFPGGGAIGRLVKMGDETSKRAWIPVVGITRSAILQFPLDAYYQVMPQVYVSIPLEAGPSTDILVRPTTMQIGPMLSAQHLLNEQFPPKSYPNTRRWLINYENTLAAREFTASVFIGLGIASLVLAAAGLFSVLSYTVGQRMREFAVRVALGANRNDMMRLVMKDGLVLALGGTAIGAFLGMWAGFLLENFLWGVHPADVGALVLAEGTLFVVTMASCIVPALRATRADPLDILRAT